MLKRLGHSETYRFTLKLETAIAKVLQESSSLVSTQIVVNLSVSAKALQESSNLLSTYFDRYVGATGVVCHQLGLVGTDLYTIRCGGFVETLN